MSPLEIKVLLHVYALVRDYRDENSINNSQLKGITDILEEFAKKDLVAKRCDDCEWRAGNPKERASQYRVTEKGSAMVEHLCAVEIPICKWVQP